MAQVYVPDSLPDSQPLSQRYNDYGFEATQLSQPVYSQTQNTQGTAFANSQVEPRKKYWATFIPTNANHSILKIPWTKSVLQIGRGPQYMSGNDVVLAEKRISNRHCRITLGLQGSSSSETSRGTMQAWKEGEMEPAVWIEDMGSSNGTFVNGKRLQQRYLLQHGDEISLGHASTLDSHDVRYIFRSVGAKGTKLGQNASKGGLDMVGKVYERYQLLDRLGAGTFAEVRKAVDVETGNMRAVKQIVKHRFAGNEQTLALFQREIAICQALQHENICRLIEYFEDPQHICLVLEYVDGGDLLDYIMNWPSENGAGLPEDLAATLTLQICRAMAYTHDMGVTHRDLKPENILLTKETPDSPQAVKIADFGLAKMVHAGTMLTSMVGTPQYLAPEVVMQNKQSPGYENVVDSWSVGIIVYSMLTKALPFDEDAALPVDKRIKSRFTQPLDENLLREHNISEQAIDFISRLLAKLPAERMTMAEALDHEWLAGPSSQRSESQPMALGGDSVWEINSFDDDDQDNNGLFDDDDVIPSDDEEGRWTRPATVSGTNMESAIGMDSGSNPHSMSDESFSQPMGNLRLTTPGLMPKSNLRLQASKLTPNGNSAPHEASPPSPPLTDEPMHVDVQSTVSVAEPSAPSALTETPAQNQDCDVTLLTPGGSDLGNVANHANSANGGTGQKRKLDVGISAFSSGSLSPPPEDAAEMDNSMSTSDNLDTPPTTATRSGRTTRSTRGSSKKDSVSVSPTKAAPGAGRRKGKVELVDNGTAIPGGVDGEGNGTGTGTRTSPRRSNRPRKSIRLA